MEIKIKSVDEMEEMAIIVLMSAIARGIVLQPKQGMDFDAITKMAVEVWKEQESGPLGFPQQCAAKIEALGAK